MLPRLRLLHLLRRLRPLRLLLLRLLLLPKRQRLSNQDSNDTPIGRGPHPRWMRAFLVCYVFLRHKYIGYGV
jgi:hypothetical protein